MTQNGQTGKKWDFETTSTVDSNKSSKVLPYVVCITCQKEYKDPEKEPENMFTAKSGKGEIEN